MSNEFVKIYHNAVPDVFCDKLIKQYEDNPQQYYHQDRKNEARNWKMSFSQIHLQEHGIWKNDVAQLMDTYKTYLKQYREDCNITDNMWPLNHTFETIRMKRYLPNDKDMFGSHVDVTDYNTARRFLVFFLYLDNNEAGKKILKEQALVHLAKKVLYSCFHPHGNILMLVKNQ